MPTRDAAPLGAPCWVDLWTTDVEGSRAFYRDLFGWEAQEPSEEFGGYFMFNRNGVPVAGGMGGMADMPAQDVWKVFLNTDDMVKALATTGDAGGTVVAPAMPVADLGIQAVLTDPTGATLGAWEPGTFPGFTVLGEHGAPDWFELLTPDHATAVNFYRSVFHWDMNVAGDTDEFRYFTMQDPNGGDDLAGIMDASAWLPAGTPAYWSVYFRTDDVDAAVARVTALGGSVVAEPESTPYGRLATVTDPAGAQFKLRAV
jgi:predicted enzyme related to lactoylglutathione lyase